MVKLRELFWQHYLYTIPQMLLHWNNVKLLRMIIALIKAIKEANGKTEKQDKVSHRGSQLASPLKVYARPVEQSKMEYLLHMRTKGKLE